MVKEHQNLQQTKLGNSGQELIHSYHVKWNNPSIEWTEKTIPKFIRTVTISKQRVPEPIYNIYTFPYDKLNPALEVRGRNRRCYMQDFATFDIETTNVSRETSEQPYAFMYIWMICINGIVLMGRTWEEWIYFIEKLHTIYDLDENRKLVIYVHNLGFEFQHIKNLQSWSNIFCKSPHKIMKATTTTNIEFRCSYFLSNRSLEEFCKNEDVLHRKVKNETFDEENGIQNYDYKKIRYPWSELTEDELAYCYNDVMGLYECIMKLLEKDDLVTIPITSTGYVRRDIKERVKSNKYRTFLRKLALSSILYTLMKEAFRGGDTHGLQCYIGQLIENVKHFDIASSYPYVIMVKKFPMTAFVEADISNFKSYIDGQELACIFRIRLENVEIKDDFTMPYIATAKCRNIKNAIYDNGRILKADMLEMTLTDIDYRIICDTYSFENQYIANLYVSRYGYLPTGIRQGTLEYFYGKTTLKHSNPYEYMKSKNRLNSIYGMMVTDLIVDEWTFDENWNTTKHRKELEKGLKEHYDSYSLFLAYQWGIWVTAWARYRLHEGRKITGDGTIYNDTDSIFCFDLPDNIFDEYNKKTVKEAQLAPIPPIVEYNGNKYVMGVYEQEHDIDIFVTWGAKKYAEMTEGKISTTVAGLSKKLGAEQLTKDGFDAFCPGWKVEPSGNLVAYYNDDQPHYLNINGNTFLTASNLALFDTSYILDVSGDFLKFREKVLTY